METPVYGMKIAQDKKDHFVGSLYMSVILIPIFNLWGFFSVVLILAGKELIWDKLLKKGTAEWMDFVWGLIPAVVVLIIKNI